LDSNTEKMQQLFFGIVGSVLVYCQLLEQAIKATRGWSAPVEAGFSYDDLFDKRRPTKETLGMTIKGLGRILNLDAELQSKLRSVLEKRNLFIHSFIEGKELDLENFEKLFEHIMSLQSFRHELQELIAIFGAFERNFAAKNIPESLIKALGADRKDRGIDKRIELWRSKVPSLFNVSAAEGK